MLQRDNSTNPNSNNWKIHSRINLKTQSKQPKQDKFEFSIGSKLPNSIQLDQTNY